jgi:hypothetical protein
MKLTCIEDGRERRKKGERVGKESLIEDDDFQSVNSWILLVLNSTLTFLFLLH